MHICICIYLYTYTVVTYTGVIYLYTYTVVEHLRARRLEHFAPPLYVDAYIYEYIYIYAYICVCASVCVCVYIYVHTHTQVYTYISRGGGVLRYMITRIRTVWVPSSALTLASSGIFFVSPSYAHWTISSTHVYPRRGRC